jgi:hypothetical protein
MQIAHDLGAGGFRRIAAESDLEQLHAVMDDAR